ncbi:hypothetical protein V500_11274 [Pseudogymnoascus sp. VKM F-4518 (FW-2643)]|nr:hypothetical protein V500_11274 [Pseudogymnoascus sp. VKM F-4518 (FW-2643)]
MDNNKPPQPGPPNTPDAPDKEAMDQIRRRRLEKLGGSTTPDRTASPGAGPSRSNSQSATDTPITQPQVLAPRVAKPQMATPPPPSPQSPLDRSKDKPANSSSSTTIRIAPADAAGKRPREASGGISGPPTRKATPQAAEESPQDFENRALSTIFRITLDGENKIDSSGHKLTFLPDVRQELEDNGEHVGLSVAGLDSILMEVCSKIPHNKPILEYLLPCWKRIMRSNRSLRGPAQQKDAILREAKRLCMSSCIFALTMPELYGRDETSYKDSLSPHFLLDPEDERGLCPEFLAEAVSRVDEDESITPMFTSAVIKLSNQLSRLTMNDNYKPYVQALKNLTRFPVITTAIAEDPVFLMATSAHGIEQHTLLGPFFRISVLQTEVTKSYFASPKTMDKSLVVTSQSALRMTLNNHQKDLLDIVNQFVRASTSSRNRTLDWFAWIVNANHKRRALRVDERQVSSDGFMMNVTVVLDGLCEPFMDSTFSKVSKIDPDYFRRSPRIDIKDETKLNSDQKTSDKFYEEKLEGTPNFITEVFFLTVAAHHYGSEAANSKLKSLDRDISSLQKQLAIYEQERPRFLSDPRQLAMIELNVKRYNDILEKSMRLRNAIEGVLFDDVMQARSLQFMRYLIVFMLRTASGSDYVPGKPFSLPLPETQPEVFKNYPEYMLDDIVSNFEFIFNYLSQVIISTQTDEIIVLCISFLRNSEYIKNPSLKSGLVSLLYHGTIPVYHRQKGVLGDALTTDKFANDNLLHALIKFYIESEHSGAANAFYNKFSIRYEIFQIFKCIWSNSVYRERLTQESKVNTEFFVRYVNLLIYDATYLLDECLTKFPKIHDLQVALSPNAAASLTEEDRKSKSEELSQLEGQAKSYMQLANETISMMKLFTGTLSDAFTMPEIVQRLADMLDYNLDTLVGPKSANLKVEDPSKYFFTPKSLLAEFIDIYLNLSHQKRFVEAVARDDRSYKPANFDSATRILERWSLKSKAELTAWIKLIAKFKAAKEIEDKADVDLGEIPDEFLDPLMATLMEDPVILPISRMTVNRSTVRSLMLSDGIDPFNRQPINIDDVAPDEEMKEKIKLFKEERRAAAMQTIEDIMDTSEP